MKHILFLLSCLAMSYVFAAAPPSNVKIFTTEKFQIAYPETWTLRARQGSQFFIDRIFGPGEVASFSVSFAKYSGDQDELSTMLASDKAVGVLTSAAKSRFPDYKVIDNNSVFLGNFPAYMIEAQYSLSNPTTSYSIRGILIMGLHERFIYRINIEATESAFEAAKNEIDIILSTFLYK